MVCFQETIVRLNSQAQLFRKSETSLLSSSLGQTDFLASLFCYTEAERGYRGKIVQPGQSFQLCLQAKSIKKGGFQTKKKALQIYISRLYARLTSLVLSVLFSGERAPSTFGRQPLPLSRLSAAPCPECPAMGLWIIPDRSRLWSDGL